MVIKPKELMDKLLNNMKKSSLKNKEALNVVQVIAHQLALPHNKEAYETADSFRVRVPVTTKNTEWMMVMDVSMYEVKK